MSLRCNSWYLLALGAVTSFGQARDYGRSMVITQQGMAATSQTLASQAGAQILAKGGSAVDAAIAANAVLGVVEPMMNGIGGDLFVIYWDAKTGKLTGLNASGPAPRGLSPEFLARQGFQSIPEGIHSVTVPGAVEGWAKMHERFGKLPWKDLFQAAIAYAEEGFPVTEDAQRYWAGSVAKLRANPETTRVYLPGGRAPRVGEVFKNPEMGRVLRILAEKGRDAFYKGEIADAILKTSRSLGGTMTAQDLASYSAEWVDPISTDYRGWKVYELPPNSQGIAALEMLNIMETLPAGKNGPHTSRRTAPQDRIHEAGVFGPAVQRRPALRGHSGARAFGERLCAQAGRGDRSEESQLLRGGGRTGVRRNNLSHDSRQRRKHRQLDPESVRLFRFRRDGGRHGVPAARPGAEFQSGSGESERVGRRQASFAHHHSRLPGKGRSAHRLRDHGRVPTRPWRTRSLCRMWPITA